MNLMLKEPQPIHPAGAPRRSLGTTASTHVHHDCPRCGCETEQLHATSRCKVCGWIVRADDPGQLD